MRLLISGAQLRCSMINTALDFSEGYFKTFETSSDTIIIVKPVSKSATVRVELSLVGMYIVSQNVVEMERRL